MVKGNRSILNALQRSQGQGKPISRREYRQEAEKILKRIKQRKKRRKEAIKLFTQYHGFCEGGEAEKHYQDALNNSIFKEKSNLGEILKTNNPLRLVQKEIEKIDDYLINMASDNYGFDFYSDQEEQSEEPHPTIVPPVVMSVLPESDSRKSARQERRKQFESSARRKPPDPVRSYNILGLPDDNMSLDYIRKTRIGRFDNQGSKQKRKKSKKKEKTKSKKKKHLTKQR